MSKKGATKTGGGTGITNNQNAERAKRMKANPHRFPDSIIHGGHNGCGSEYRRAPGIAAKSKDVSAAYHDAMAFGMMIDRAGGLNGIMSYG